MTVARSSVDAASLDGAVARLPAEANGLAEEMDQTDAPMAAGGASDPLTDLADFLGSFVAFPSPEARDAVALWVAHCYLIDGVTTTARLSIRSAEKQCGKTRLMEILELVVIRSLPVVNCSVAALFRSIEAPPPTILWDEVDAVFRGGNDPGRDDLRALLNSGYRRGASVRRVVGEGKRMEVKSFPTFAPAALAGIGDLPDTISDRSIIIEMRRRLPGECVRQFRRRDVEPEAAALRERLTIWATRRSPALEQARPRMPDELSDRAQDLWEPLLALADLAGGTWPKRARNAARALHAVGQKRDGSLGVRLLADIRAVFEQRSNPDSLGTATVLETLADLEESPWGDIRGRPLDARGLARRLRPFGVTPRQVRIGTVTLKGYLRADLADPWARYLPAPPVQRETSETSETSPTFEPDRLAVSRDQAPPVVSVVSVVSPPGGGGTQRPDAPLGSDEDQGQAVSGHDGLIGWVAPVPATQDQLVDLLPLEVLAEGPDCDPASESEGWRP